LAGQRDRDPERRHRLGRGVADAVRRGLRERRQADGTYVPLEQSEAKE
jgi:hypothetical protein